MKKILIFTLSLFLMGCGNNGHEGRNGLSVSDSIEMTKEESVEANADLMPLLDTLCKHVDSEGFPAKVRVEEKWMSDYRSRLSAYYREHKLGNDTLSVFAEADSVLNIGIRIMEQNSRWTTADMIESASKECAFSRCREYGLLSQVIKRCERDEARELIYKEWSLYERMLKKFGRIAANMVSLNNWGGSISGPLRSASYLHISESRRDMYQTLVNIMNDDIWDGTGIPLSIAERLLFDCCSTALHRVSENQEHGREFDKSIKETETAVRDLRPMIDEWIRLMGKVDEELTSDGRHHSMERSASFMLMKWASMVTEE